jgi:predicted nucleic acid-binding protein
VIDTDILVLADRQRAPLNLGRWSEYGSAYLSAITASELLVGVHRAQTQGQRNRRNAFVESVLAAIPVLPFDLECARVHAQLVASLPRNETIGAHDALIAGTALRHGHSVLTNNGRDFRKLAGVLVVEYGPPGEEVVEPSRSRRGEANRKDGADQQTTPGVPLHEEVARILAQFSNWVSWKERDRLENTDLPGIYLIAEAPATGIPSLGKPMLYVGETTGDTQSLKRRMSLFQRASIDGEAKHSGGRTFFRKCRQRISLDECSVAVHVLSRDEPLSSTYIKYVERLLLLAHVQRFRQLPDCNNE